MEKGYLTGNNIKLRDAESPFTRYNQMNMNAPKTMIKVFFFSLLLLLIHALHYQLTSRQLCGLEAHKTLCVVVGVLHHIVDIGNLVSPM